MTYGNLINRIQERVASPLPTKGDGATVYAYSDRYAGTVYSVGHIGKSGRPIVTVQEDAWVRTDGPGFADSQTYEYSRDIHGRWFYFRQDRSGKWREVRKNPESGRWIIYSGGCGVRFGLRDKRHDFSF